MMRMASRKEESHDWALPIMRQKREDFGSLEVLEHVISGEMVFKCWRPDEQSQELENGDCHTKKNTYGYIEC